ncbi:MAG: hemolysin family protein [Clostridia bacterium]|nr:hemolysin family protein [Clostridia bacterium]
MDSDSWIRVILYLVCILCGAYFAAAESAFSAMNKIRIKSKADDGDERAIKALAIHENFEKALTSLLIGTNVMHICCATLSSLIFISLLGEEREGTAAVCATVVTTVLVYFISELIPKCLAKANTDKYVRALAPSLRILMIVLTPLVLFFNGISSFLVRLFPASNEPTYTEDELTEIIETGEEEGVIDEERSDILQSAIEFTETCVSDVMTVIEDIQGIGIDTPSTEVLNIVQNNKHSRIPVFDAKNEKIIGVLPIREYLKRYISTGKLDVKRVMYKPLVVEPETPIQSLFDKMRNNKIYMAVVADEDGKTIGIATIEDFLEELVGEIWDENDVVDPDFIKLGGYNYDVSVKLNVGEVFSRIGYETNNFKVKTRTINAWMVEQLGHIPEEEEKFEFEDLTIECSEVEDGKPIRAIISINDDEEEEEDK